LVGLASALCRISEPKAATRRDPKPRVSMLISRYEKPDKPRPHALSPQIFAGIRLTAA
jgi:hypothetical protein